MKHDGAFLKISGRLLQEALATSNRQYLVGNLQLPQQIDFIHDERLEIGVTKYDQETSEAPHWHTVQREYQYMLAGRTIYTDVITGETLEYRADDFYGILPEICYSQVSDPGTMILFIKYPAMNDKMVCRHCERRNCPGRIEPFRERKAVPSDDRNQKA